MSSQAHDDSRASIGAAADLDGEAVAAVAALLRLLLADVFALYLKAKNFHWHMSGPHFRDYHLLLDEQADQVLAMSDVIAERCRKLGAPALRSISDIARHQRLRDNNDDAIAPAEMLAELLADNRRLAQELRSAHGVCDRCGDVATASLIETWIDEAEHRGWFLSEALRSY